MREQCRTHPLASGEQHVEFARRRKGETSSARLINSSVVSPIAEITTTTSWPSLLVATIRLATRLMLSASATEEAAVLLYYAAHSGSCSTRRV